jgi:hypothetical protein
MHRTYFADRGARHKAKLGQVFRQSPLSHAPIFGLFKAANSTVKAKVFLPLGSGASRAIVESLSSNISRSTGEDRIGRKPFLYSGRGNSILTQSPERFGP